MHTYEAGLSDQRVQSYVEAYLELKSRYWRVMLPLFIAYGGQAALCVSFLEEQLSRRFWPLGFVVAGVPWLVYFAVSFIRVPPPILPQAFRRVLLFVVYWYATSTIFLVMAAIAGLIPADARTPLVATAVWACALSGWLGVPTLLRCSRSLADQGPAA